MTATHGTAVKPLLGTICAMNLIEFLQSGMIVFAAVPIMGQISASPEEFSVVSVLYAAIAIVSISQLAALVQRLGWRRYVLGSLGVFAAGAFICANSHDLVTFGLGRALMAAGGGPFMSTARVVINLFPPSPLRIKGILAFGVGLGLGLAGGSGIAAGMVAHDQWYGIFYLLIAIAACAAVLALRCLPADAAGLTTPTRFSMAPCANLLIGSFATLYALQRASFDFHSEALPLVAWLVLGLIALVWFVYQQAGGAEPFLRLRQLVNRRFLFGLGVFTVAYVVLGATNVMLPVFIQRGLGVAQEVAGMAQTIGFGGGLLGFVGTLLVVKHRPAARKFYVAGFVFLGLFGWSLSKLNGQSNLWTDIVPPMVLFSAFVVVVMATTALNSFRDLQHDEVTFVNGQQLKNMLSQFGLGLGVACANVGFQQRITQHYSVLGERFVAGGAELTARLGQLGDAPAAMQAALAPLAQQLTQQSVLVASVEYFWLLMWLAIAGAVVMLAQRIFD